MIPAIFAAMALLPPNIPPPPERTTPLPAYSAKCRLAGRNARDFKLSLAIDGVGGTRRATFRSGSGPLKRLVAVDERPTTMSTGNREMLWDTSDVIKATLDSKSVNVWLEVEPDLSKGVAIRIKDPNRSLGVPLFSGMCRAKPLEVSTSS